MVHETRDRVCRVGMTAMTPVHDGLRQVDTDAAYTAHEPLSGGTTQPTPCLQSQEI